MPEKFKIPENLDPETKRIIEKGLEGPDRRKEKPKPGDADTQKEIADEIYNPFRKAHKKRIEKENAKKIKGLAMDAQRMEWNDERRGDPINL